MGAENQSLNRLAMRVAGRADNMSPTVAVATFVRLEGLTAFLDAPQHQIIYGRRGSGKTHAFLFMSAQVREDGNIPIYVDMRQVGSSGGIYGDPRVSLAERATQLLVDILEAVHEALLSAVLDSSDETLDGVLPLLDGIVEAAASVQVVGDVELESTETARHSRDTGTELGLDPKKVGLKFKATELKASEQAERTVIRGRQRPHLIFGNLGRAWRQLAEELAPRSIWLLLDEWTSLPAEIQPVLADLIRRTFLLSPNVVVKIGAVERAARFQERYEDGDYIGIELGADVPLSISIDEYLLGARGSGEAPCEDFLQELIAKHLVNLVREFGYADLKFPDAAAVCSSIFLDVDAWGEFEMAAEGVPRDALHILASAAQKAGSRAVGKAQVRLAAKQYYLNQKRPRVSHNRAVVSLLESLLNDVLVKRHRRTFSLLRDEDSLDPRIRELYESRLLHIVVSGAYEPARPGTLYDVFAIDYGCFVDSLTETNVGLLREMWNAPPTASIKVEPGLLRDNLYRLPRSRNPPSVGRQARPSG